MYTSPGEYLYSTQHPPNVYRLKVGYSTEASADAGAIMLGSVQVRHGSERVLLDGRPLIRDVDYRVDYDLGRLTFARPETLFTRQRAVTVKYEENPLFAVGATKLYGLTSTLSLANGELNLIAVQQSQNTDFTRPQLGFEPVSSILAGVNGQFSWEVSPITRLVNKLPFVNSKAPSRISVSGEIATSRPQLNSNGQAYVESFEGEAGITVNLSDQSWALSSQPADGHLLPRRYGANPFDLRRASTIAFQNNGTNPTSGTNILVTRDSIDSNASFLGIGSTSYETLLWMTLYPLEHRRTLRPGYAHRCVDDLEHAVGATLSLGAHRAQPGGTRSLSRGRSRVLGAGGHDHDAPHRESHTHLRPRRDLRESHRVRTGNALRAARPEA